MKPDPYIDLVEWANAYFRLTKESSVEPGQYRTSRTPYVEEILMELSPQSPTNEVVVVKPTQFGFTTLGNIFLFSTAHLYPGPAMMAMPTDDMAKKHSKKKIAPSVKAVSCMNSIIKKAKSRDSGNTLLLKEFPGGSWTFTGSNSPASARSDSVRYLILDDYDGFVQEAGDEGAPGDLLKKRTDAFGNKKKIYINSTPTLKGASHIEKEWEESSQGHFNVPCPHCGKMQFLVFGGVDSDHGIKFTRDDDGQVVDVWYLCKHCHSRIDEWQKTEMLSRGRYIHKYHNRKKRGFKINALYSPMGWLSWGEIVTEFLKAVKSQKAGNPLPMKVWVNTRMAETFEEDGDQPEWEKLSSRAEPYKVLNIPRGGLLLCAGVDTQDNRLEVLIKAYGRAEENWIVYHSAIYGDPDLPGPWESLDELLQRPYRHESGADMFIVSMGIDTGGHKTQAVYNYCRIRAPRVFALKGANATGKPILNLPTKQDVDFMGKKIPNGVELWSIGTDTAKGTIYNRLKIPRPGPGFYHFPIGLDDEFYKQLTAEKITRKFVDGYPVYKWVNTRERNEVLDCDVYCYAAALKAGLTRMDWDRVEAGLGQHRPSGVQPQQRQRSQAQSRPQRKPGGYQRPAWMR